MLADWREAGLQVANFIPFLTAASTCAASLMQATGLEKQLAQAGQEMEALMSRAAALEAEVRHDTTCSAHCCASQTCRSGAAYAALSPSANNSTVYSALTWSSCPKAS